MPTFSPAEIEEELKALQDVPSLLSHYVGVEPAGKEKVKGSGGSRRWISVGSSAMCAWHVPGTRDRSILCLE